MDWMSTWFEIRVICFFLGLAIAAFFLVWFIVLKIRDEIRYRQRVREKMERRKQQEQKQNAAETL